MHYGVITRRIRRCESETPAQLVLEHAINEAILAEREACAELCEDNCAGYDYAQAEFCLTEFPKECGGRHDGMTYAKAIRARGEKK